MIDFLAQSGTAPFSVALVLIVLLGVVESIGLGSSAIEIDIDTSDAGAIASGLDWLNIGRLPLLMLLVVFLTVFGLAGLARVLPRDETTAVAIDTLVGRRARIVIGTARRGHPARARVEDQHGQVHFVMVEPLDDSSLTAAAMLLLTARHGDIFHAVEIPTDIFSMMRPVP